VIFTGLSIGTLFTLFVVPAVYILIGATHSHAPEPVPNGDNPRKDADAHPVSS
jgi:multidrug efflux pump